MIARGFKRVMVAGAVVVAMGVSGSGFAHAATLVLSDQVRWKGTAVVHSDGTVDFGSKRCQLVSDGEEAVPCHFNAHGTIDPAAGVITGTAVTESSDGVITDNLTLTPNPDGSGAFTTRGKCTEQDTPDPGEPNPPKYPCREKGQGVATQNADGTYTVTGTFRILETSTAP